MYTTELIFQVVFFKLPRHEKGEAGEKKVDVHFSPGLYRRIAAASSAGFGAE